MVVITRDVCDLYQWHDTIYRQSGQYFWHDTTTHGCDSTEQLLLTVRKTTFSTLDSTVCSGDLPLVWNGQTFTDSGRANVTIPNVAGCDSVILMNVIVKHSTYRDVYDTIVENQLPYDTLNMHFTGAGTKMDTIPNVAGCDSIITFHLHVWPNAPVTELDTVICEGALPFAWFDSTFTSAGQMTVALNTQHGADSVVIMRVMVIPTAYTVVNDEVNEGETYIGNGFVVPADETVNVPEHHLSLQNTLVSVNGCDSVVTLELDIIVPPAPPSPPDPPGPPQPEPLQPEPAQPELLLSVMQLPNAITPSNSDGHNDFFGLPEEYIDQIGECEIIIFNRWGETVFYSNDKHFRWYGDYKGKICKDQVFGYKMKLFNLDGILYRKKGSILVL